MMDLQDNIGSKANCAGDLGKSNVVVAKEAQIGFGNYDVMRKAAGLVDPDTGIYCYLEAIASSQPDDLYLWALPAGIS